MSKNYINLHNHLHGSILDGFSRPKEYCAQAKALGMQAVASTDHGNLHSLMDMYHAAEEYDLKYFPGAELYQARKSRFSLDPEELSRGAKHEFEQRGPYHLGAIAYNNEGYHNLLKLSSRAYTEGYYGKPRVDHELLAEHSKGIVLLSGCLSGEVQQALLRDDFDFALQTAVTMQDMVGRENYFIEIMNHGIEEELKTHPGLLEIARLINAPIVATCDCHYTHKHQSTAHDIMLCMNTGARIDTPDRFRFVEEQFYLKSYEEMALLFPEEYLDNTNLILEKHDFKLEFGEYHFPKFKTPDDRPGEEFFLEEVYRGAEKRFGANWRSNQKVVDRLNYETGVIKEMGFPDYFLIVADLVQFAKNHKPRIMVGPARGSAAGALVSYCMEITEVDPLEYDLPFERFLVPGRKSPPDIDLDFDDRYRDIVQQYAQELYGYDHTAYIGTFSELGAKSAIKDVARVLNYDYKVGDAINKAMPPALFGVTKSLTECLATEDFRALYEKDEDVKIIVDTAMQFEGLWRQPGRHAAALVISDRPITDYVPVLQKGPDEPIVTQWEMNHIDKAGLLKVDFLALRNVAIIDMALDNIYESTGIRIEEPYKLIADADPEVYAALSIGENTGVFQMEGAGMRHVMVGLKPDGFNDIAALLALYRPGPMGSNIHNEYIERKHGRKPVTYIHPSVKPYLESTYGLLLYQEQLLFIARFVAGFTVPDSDSLRKAVGKKDMVEMKKWRERFVEGCVTTSEMPRGVADKLFSEIEHHASYSFSICHAVGYGFISYVTAYLRIKYPAEFMAAVLSSMDGDASTINRLRLYLSQCKEMGLTVVPPVLGKTGQSFTVLDQEHIGYGFKAVKGVGPSLIEVLESDDNKYENIYDFLRKSNNTYLSIGVVRNFLNAGCFDQFLGDMDIPEIPDLNRQQKMSVLYDELMSLGIFLTDHPFNDVGDLIAGKTTHTLKELTKIPAREKVSVAGIVIECTKKITRAGKSMYNMRIEDLDMSMQVDIMPAAAAKLPEDPYKTGDIIVVNGIVKREGDEEAAETGVIYFNGEKVDDSHLSGGNPIILKSGRGISYENIKRINDIIESTPGNSPVFLEFVDNNTEIKMRFKALTSKSIEPALKFLTEV